MRRARADCRPARPARSSIRCSTSSPITVGACARRRSWPVIEPAPKFTPPPTLGVADVGEMIGLAAAAERARLHLDEVADVHFVVQNAPPGRNARIRPDAAVARRSSHRSRCENGVDARPAPDRHVAQHAVRPTSRRRRASRRPRTRSRRRCARRGRSRARRACRSAPDRRSTRPRASAPRHAASAACARPRRAARGR